MLRKVLTLALAVVFVTSVAAFACGGDKGTSKTSEVQKTSSQTASCATKDVASVQTASSESNDAVQCPYIDAAQTATAKNSDNAEIMNAAYTSEKGTTCTAAKAAESGCTVNKDACVKSASANGAPSCGQKAGDVSKTASEGKTEKLDADKTVMVEKAAAPEKL